MSPTALHLGLFAGGLVLGAGATAFATRKTAQQQQEAPLRPAQKYPPADQPAAKPAGQPDVFTSIGTPGTLVDKGFQTVGNGLTRSDDWLAKTGFPGPINDVQRRIAFTSAYDRRLRHPAWTAEHLTPESLSRPPPPPGSPGGTPGGGDRQNSAFKEDNEIPATFRARLADYFRSGYDRGHMVPAADAKASQAAMDETFYLTNIAPQVGEGFNRDYWAHFENFVRNLTKTFPDVYVFTVPLYLPRQSSADRKWRVTYEVIGNPPSVAVPTHFAKVILAARPPAKTSIKGAVSSLVPTTTTGSASQAVSRMGLEGNELSMAAFVLPNAVIPNEAPLRSFEVPVDTVERAAGLTFFPPAMKSASKKLCDSIKCDIVVRSFDDSRKKALSAPAASSR